MKTAYGDLWTYPADYRCITTNGFVKKTGEAVMGRGCALEAKEKYPDLPLLLGAYIKANGNIVLRVKPGLFTFPVKHNWWEKADLKLIEKSALQLVDMINWTHDNATVVLPRPGCGNGQLDWEDVERVIAPLLDDRFTVITNTGT